MQAEFNLVWISNVSGDAFYKWRPSKEGRWDFTVQCAAPGLFKMAIYRSSCFGTELSCQNLVRCHVMFALS